MVAGYSCWVVKTVAYCIRNLDWHRKLYSGCGENIERTTARFDIFEWSSSPDGRYTVSETGGGFGFQPHIHSGKGLPKFSLTSTFATHKLIHDGSIGGVNEIKERMVRGPYLLFSMYFVHIILDFQNIESGILAKEKSQPIIVVTQTWFSIPCQIIFMFQSKSWGNGGISEVVLMLDDQI